MTTPTHERPQQLMLDQAPAPQRTWRDVATEHLREACDMVGIRDRLDQALFRRLKGDNRHLEIAADLLLMDVLDAEEGDYLEEGMLWEFARLGAMRLMSDLVVEDGVLRS